ncbi:MAG: hypothetical protein WC997_15795 [Porticoccaceae bacterium]
MRTIDRERNIVEVGGRMPLAYMQDGYGFNRAGACLGRFDAQGEQKSECCGGTCLQAPDEAETSIADDDGAPGCDPGDLAAEEGGEGLDASAGPTAEAPAEEDASSDQDERARLEGEAEALGIAFRSNISDKSLRERIEAAKGSAE